MADPATKERIMTTFAPRASGPESPEMVPALGRPHVFGLEGLALPVAADARTSGCQAEVGVSLLMTPIFDEPFDMRSPRGSFSQQGLFILRCPGLVSPAGALARTMSVRELVGVRFDIVTAELVRPHGDTSPTPDTRTGERLTTSPIRPAEPTTASTRPSDLQRHGSATAIEIDGVKTIAGQVSATLHTTIRVGEPITLTAPRGEIPQGAYFALRYFNASGARRALILAQHVRAQPGMLDEITGVLLRPTTPAPERQYFRVPLDRLFSAQTVGGNARTVRGCMIDLSADGVGLRTATQLVPGDRLELADPSLGELDGATFTILRIDPRDNQRYGARFDQPERGAATVSAIVGFGRADHEHRRLNRLRAARDPRIATATPITTDDTFQLRNRRMGTRKRYTVTR